MERLDVPRRLLMGSGPSNPEPRVLQALAGLALSADDPAAASVYDDVATLTRGMFQAPEACALAIAGASRSGIEAAIASAVEPGDRVLVGVYGHFGELLCTLAARHGASVERVEADWGTAVDLEVVRRRIRERKPALVAIVHADTSTGILQPLDGLGVACQENGALFLVDAVLSAGGTEVAFDRWQVDMAVAGLQKCLGGPPGLALLAFSAEARTRFQGRATLPQSPYLDLGRRHAEWHDRPTTAVPHMLFAAREALRIVLEEGLEARWRRHQLASDALRAGLAAMGLQVFADPRHRVPMITLVSVPDGVDEAGVRAELLEQHGIEIMAAFGPLRGRVWRIGTMGTNAGWPSVLAVLSGLEAVLAARGFTLPRGAGVDAALSAASAADPI